MIPYTETYHKARVAGALPIFLLYLGTDRGLRCFGKHTPTPEQVGDDALEWSARVLTFGDFRESLSSDSEIYLQGLFEEEVSSYGAELDSADGYFQEIAGKEVFLNGDCILLQGFDYPGFAHADFIPKFFGKIETFEFDNLRFKFTAIQAVAPQVPEDPSVTSESIYALSNAGTGYTGASESYPYADLEESFYAEESWTYTVEVTLDTITESVFFRLENAAYNNNRLEIGVDGSGYPYVTICDDVDTASPTYTTYPADWSLSASESTRVEVEWDQDAGTVTIKDNFGHITLIELSTVVTLDFSLVFGSGGASDVYGDCAVHPTTGKVYVVNTTSDSISIYDQDGTFSSSFGSSGSGDGQFTSPIGIAFDPSGTFYVLELYRIQQFSGTNTYLSKFTTPSTSRWLAISPDGSQLYVTNSNDYVEIYSNSGTLISSFGSSGTGAGEFDDPTGITVDSLGIVYVADSQNGRVQSFSGSGTFAAQFAISGATRLYGLQATGGYLYVGVNSTGVNTVQEFLGGVLNATYSPASPQTLNTAYGIANSTSTFFVSTFGTDKVHSFIRTENPAVSFDRSDNGSNDDLIVMEDVDGESPTMSLGDWQTVNTDNTATEWEDIVDGVNVTLDDGTWVDSTITIETYTETLEKLESADPTEALIFPDTSRYSNPGENQQNVILPLPYGNVRENSDGGVWVCPLIDNVNYVYAVAGWPIQSVANGNTVDIYVDGVLQSSGYAFDESNDYESQGDIAIVTFTSDPGGTVTAKCNGKWVDGALPTNPVDIIEDFMGYAAELVGSAAWEQDPTTFAIARNVANTASYKCAGIITSNNSLGYWIKAILKSFLGGFRFNSDGKLEIKLTPLEESEAVHEWLDEYEAITARAKQNVKNICGRIVVNYANSYAEIDRRFKEGGESSYFRTADKSQDAINPQSWTLDFDWCRNSDNISLMQDILLALYADPEYNVTYQGQDFKYVPLSLTDQIQATFSFLRDNDNAVAEDVIYRIREKTINLDNFTTSMMLQSVNFVAVSDPAVNFVTLGGENVTLGGEQVTLGGA